MTTIHISENTHTELKKIKFALSAVNGKDRSFDDVIALLIKVYKESKT